LNPAVVSLLLAGWATGDPRVAQGREIYATACAACHGQDGRGNPDWEYPVRPIDLGDCGTTAEPTELWESIVRRGGAAHGLDSGMPAFGDAFSDPEVGAVVAYLRTLCPKADSYPPGDLNFRRTLRTGKAFPEIEWVLRASHRPDEETRETELELVYENRLGPRFQYELELPVRVATAVPGEGAGVGDLVVAGKQVLGFDVRRREILSGGLELAFPTGSESNGLTSGTVVVTPFLAYGRGFGGRGRTVLQARAGLSLPWDADLEPSRALYALALSQSLGPARTSWTPAVEWVGDVELDGGLTRHAVWLEVSKPLTRLGHVIAATGVRLPIRPSSDSWSLEFYLLWDFGDGSLWEGW
jgi:mono/diheme cytochrome c family protein